MENNELILVTAAGLISGKLVATTDDDLDAVNVLATLSSKFTNDYREDHDIPVDAILDGNDGYISLENVTIRNGQK